MEIGEPTLLTKLPRAGLSEEGSRWFCQVYGVRDGKSKKRHEICAAVDGNALNVIEVINGRSVTSWPIPPDSYFVSEPYSERVHLNNEAFLRRCWCATQRRGRTAIQYFEQAKTGEKNTTSTTSHHLNSSQSKILKIEPISKRERVVVVVQEDGNISVLPSDGGVIQKTYKLGQNAAPIKLHAVRSMSLDAARAGVLKGRPDLSSTLTDDHIIVAAVYRLESSSAPAATESYFGVWALKSNTPSTDDHLLEPLVSHELRHPDNFGTTSRATASFKPTGTEVELSVASSIVVFDLTTAYPLKIREQKPHTAEQISSIDLSQDVKFVFAPAKLQVFNARFNSLLASLQLSPNSNKRKRDGSNFARLSFIAYFSQLRRVLAHSGSQLLAIDIHMNDSTQHLFKQSSLLIGNILRGRVEQPQVSKTQVGPRDDREWSEKAKQLAELADAQDIETFEREVKVSCGLHEWGDLKNLDSAKVDFLISKIFVATCKPESLGVRLRLTFNPSNLLNGLIGCGFVDQFRVMKALQMVPASSGSSIFSDCFIEADPSFRLLEDYIRHAPYIEPSILTNTAKTLIGQALEVPKADINQPASSDIRMEITEGNSSQIVSHGNKDRPQQSISSTSCLVYTLQRLALTRITTVSSELRKSFEQKEVLALIQFLRQQLFLGGYTRLVETTNKTSLPASLSNGGEPILHSDSPQIDLSGIVTLLNGCVDSLGIVGILGSSDDQAFVEKLVPELHSEIGKAAIAIEDSTYIQGLVRETLRYAESVERQPFEVRSKVERTGETKGAKGKITILFTEDDTTDNKAQRPTALPLSLKAEEDLSKQKLRKGGQISSRSSREMGMLKDRLRGPYSFERLIL